MVLALRPLEICVAQVPLLKVLRYLAEVATQLQTIVMFGVKPGRVLPDHWHPSCRFHHFGPWNSAAEELTSFNYSFFCYPLCVSVSKSKWERRYSGLASLATNLENTVSSKCH
jgi:hypothetical protein